MDSLSQASLASLILLQVSAPKTLQRDFAAHKGRIEDFLKILTSFSIEIMFIDR